MIRFLSLSVVILCLTFTAVQAQPAPTCDCTDGTDCTVFTGACTATCTACEANQQPGTNQNFSAELENHLIWFQDIFWLDAEAGDEVGLLAAIMLMAEQLTANAVQQTQMIGSIFDAKHQLETQRLFQQLTAQAHKDYHPSEELCTVGTVARPLAASERKANLTAQYISKHSVDRQLLAHDDMDGRFIENSTSKDKQSRLRQFILEFCNIEDNARNLNHLCLRQGAERPEAPPYFASSQNRDIDYTAFIDGPLTLDIDFTDADNTRDERALFALTNHLIAEEIMPNVAADKFTSEDGRPSYGAAGVTYINARSLAAKRSVATNSIAAIASLKSRGSPESDPFIYAIIDELFPAGTDASEITNYIGENPSYYAQMEILTKKLYQHPNFYAGLYDKPANILRKDVAIQAAELMQKRDIYRSLLRSEAVLAVMLETSMEKEQSSLINFLGGQVEDGWVDR